MKTRFGLLTTAILLCACFACNNSNDNESMLSSISLLSNKSVIMDDSGGSFTLTVKGDDFGDYTANAEYYVNDSKISSNVFNPEGKTGVYKAYAKVGELQSNIIKLNVVGKNFPFDNIAVSASITKVLAKYGQTNFTVEGIISGVDTINITEWSQILVDGTAIEGFSFTPAEVKSYEVSASFFGQNSNKITISGVATPSAFVHKVLVEDFTGVWCPNCTRVLHAIDQIHEQTDKVLVAAIHRGDATGGKADPWNVAKAPALEDAICEKFSMTRAQFGLPFAAVNRSYGNFNLDVNKTIGDILPSSPYGITISSTLGATDGTIEVTTFFLQDLPGAKLVVYVLEDNLICDQVNGSDAYGGGSILKDFNHKHVVRAVATDILGTAIPEAQCLKDSSYKTSFSASYKSENIDNLTVLAFILNQRGDVVNVQGGPANQIIPFDAIVE